MTNTGNTDRTPSAGWGPRAGLVRFLRDEAGVTAIEYGLLAALIVVVASGAIALMGGGANGMWTKVTRAILNAIP
jgi:pilus assembly protein Flp/PilA